MTGETFTVLTVCTGNICRSRLAELVLAQRFADVAEIRILSAGTHAAVGAAMPEEAQEIAGFMGVLDVPGGRPRQVDSDVLGESDLILTMTRSQRRAMVELNPRIVRRAFTIRELASLAAATRDESIVEQGAYPSADRATRLRAAIGAATRQRSRRRGSELPSQDDVVDPFGCDRDIYALSALQLSPAVEGVAVLFQRALNLGEWEQ